MRSFLGLCRDLKRLGVKQPAICLEVDLWLVHSITMALGFLNNNKLLGISNFGLSIRWCHGGNLDVSCLLIAKAQLVALHFGADDGFRWGQGNEKTVTPCRFCF